MLADDWTGYNGRTPSQIKHEHAPPSHYSEHNYTKARVVIEKKGADLFQFTGKLLLPCYHFMNDWGTTFLWMHRKGKKKKENRFSLEINSTCMQMNNDTHSQVEIGGEEKKQRKQWFGEERSDVSRKWSTETKRGEKKDGWMRQRAGGVSRSPAARSGNSLEHKGMVDGGWVNSPRKCYTQMHPSCRMNYSSPTVCTGFWRTTKTLEHVWKTSGWVATWIKHVKKMNNTTQTQPSATGVEEKNREKAHCPIAPKFFIF